jgi:hypothetical protein
MASRPEAEESNSSSETTVARSSLCSKCKVFQLTRWAVATYDEIPLHFVLYDTLPVLPYLERSSQAGCDFCRQLREVLLSEIVISDGAKIGTENIGIFCDVFQMHPPQLHLQVSRNNLNQTSSVDVVQIGKHDRSRERNGKSSFYCKLRLSLLTAVDRT